VVALARRIGPARLTRDLRALQDHAEAMMRATLRSLPAGTYRAVDWLDDDGLGTTRIPIRVAVTIARGRARVDFTGSAPQVRGPVNANLAVTRSAVLYVFTALAGGRLPTNDGIARPIEIVAPPGTVVHATLPAAVAGGNVETSQRVVDVLLRALARAAPNRIPAASTGSMNNVALGGVAADGRAFAYYETLAGGAGAGPGRSGASAVHTHMTNTMNTPVEALEAYYPIRVRRYALRPGSGGRGRWKGGDGLVREIELVAAARVTLLTERRTIAPYGLAGGGPGARGRNVHVRGRRARPIPGKITLDARPGDRVRVETPGGGGYGRSRRRVRDDG
jgi:N-methylhydantoinase B